MHGATIKIIVLLHVSATFLGNVLQCRNIGPETLGHYCIQNRRYLIVQDGCSQPVTFKHCVFEYAIRRVQVNQDGFKLNGTHQFLAYADDVNILGGNAHTVKENAEL